jgi:hypothetical protein
MTSFYGQTQRELDKQRRRMRSYRTRNFLRVWAPLLVGIVGFGAYLAASPTEPASLKVVEQQGFTNVHYTGFRFWGCGRGDWYHTGFTATAPNGTPTSGIVCDGLFFKGKTVRFD